MEITYKLKLTIDNNVYEIFISPNISLLDNLKEFDIPYSCLKGYCSSCICKLESGDVEMRESLALTDKEIKNGFILTCQSYAKSDIHLIF